jgi:hypothetical protein
MAQPVRQTLAAEAATNPVVSNYHVTPFNVNVTVIPGTACTYSIQYTMDDPFNNAFDPTTANWIDHPNGIAQTGTLTVQFVTPVCATRVNQTTYGSGTTTVVTLAAGISQGG